jgi:Ser/Thr protein kinase RdoA (MazF antagonist)
VNPSDDNHRRDSGEAQSQRSALPFFVAPTVRDSDLDSIAELFSARCADTVFLGGLPNVTFKAMTTSGAIAIRVCNTEYTPSRHLEDEVAALLYLARAGFKQCPRLIQGRDGRYVQQWREHTVIATSFVDGVLVSQLAFTPDLMRSIGALVGNLTSALDGFRLAKEPQSTYEVRTERLFERIDSIGSALGWPVDFGFIRNVWDRESRLILGQLGSQELRPAHTDVWPQNLLQASDGLYLIDFDDLAMANSLLDLASALSEFVIDDEGEASVPRAAAMIAGFLSRCRRVVTRQNIDELVAGICCSYASWLACDAAHGCDFEYSERYYRRLERLSRIEFRSVLLDQLSEATETARKIRL